jgi:hypothetical protein
MSYEIRNYAWSKKSDFDLPAWSSSKGKWINGFEALWGCTEPSKLIKNVNELSQILETEPSQNLERKIVYIPHNLVAEKKLLWRQLCDQFNLDYPLMNKDDEFVALSHEYNNPVLGIVLDQAPPKNRMSQLTIMIPHWESLGFLRMCLWSISKHYKDNMPTILVIDDLSGPDTYSGIEELQKKYPFDLVQIHRPNKSTVADVGMLLDLGLEYIKTKYVCMLDADTLHISKDAYTDALAALSNRSIVSCGLDTGLGRSYHNFGALRHFRDFYPYDVSLPGVSTITNNLFRVMRTMDALAVARSAKFSRQVENRKLRDQLGRSIRKLSGMTKNTQVIDLSKSLIKSRYLNSQYPSMPPTGDNGVSANHWMEENGMGLKMNLPITSYGVISSHDGICFQNIQGNLIHIALSTRALSKERREIEDAGEEFYAAIKKIAKNTFEEEQTYKEVVTLSQKFSVLF